MLYFTFNKKKFDDICEFSEKLANNNKIVIISALNGDFKRSNFKNVINLIPKVESIYTLSAICMNCKLDAHFSFRKVVSNKKIIIGGKDKYIPLCRQCYNIFHERQ